MTRQHGMKCNSCVPLTLWFILINFRDDGRYLGRFGATFQKVQMPRVQFAHFRGQVGIVFGLPNYLHIVWSRKRIPPKRAKLRFFVHFLCNLHDWPSTRHGTAAAPFQSLASKTASSLDRLIKDYHGPVPMLEERTLTPPPPAPSQCPTEKTLKHWAPRLLLPPKPARPRIPASNGVESSAEAGSLNQSRCTCNFNVILFLKIITIVSKYPVSQQSMPSREQ